jgi:transcriptional regulator with XRE-family HTH domain
MPKAKGDTALYKIREKLNLTQEEFAHQTGIAQATIASIESSRRNVTPALMEKIRAVFGDIDSASPRAAKLTEISFETTAMNKVFQALLPLSEQSRQRVLDWVHLRLKSDQSEQP